MSTFLSRQQQRIGYLTQSLVLHFLGLERTEQDPENVAIATDFCLENLKHHSFIDTDEHAVTRSIKDVCERFELHNQVALAKSLNASFAELTRQLEKPYPVVQLLVSLSRTVTSQSAEDSDAYTRAYGRGASPAANDSQSGVSSANPVQTSRTGILSKPGSVGQLLDDELLALPKEFLTLQLRWELEFHRSLLQSDDADASPLSASEELVRRKSVDWEHEWSAALEAAPLPTQYESSKSTDDDAISSSSNNSKDEAGQAALPDFAELVLDRLEHTRSPVQISSSVGSSISEADTPSVTIPEEVVVQHAVSMLQGVSSPVFSLQHTAGDEMRFVAVPTSLSLTHLSDRCVENTLASLCVVGTKLMALRHLGVRVRGTGQCPEAFAAFLVSQIDAWRSVVSSSSATSLLSLLCDIEHVVRSVDMIYDLAVHLRCTPSSVHHMQTHAFLSSLYDLKNSCMLRSGAQSEAYDRCQLLGSLFASAVEPYIRMLNRWCQEGILEDPKHEFMIAETSRHIDPFTVDDWKNRFLITATSGTENAIPNFLRPYAETILFCGKAIRLIKAMYDRQRISRRELVGLLSKAPVANAKPRIGGCDESSVMWSLRDKRYRKLYNNMSTVVRADALGPHQRATMTVIDHCILPLVRWSRQVSATLNKLVLGSGRAMEHLSCLRDFFLMHNGEVAHSFCSGLFTKITESQLKSSDTIDAVLQDSLRWSTRCEATLGSRLAVQWSMSSTDMNRAMFTTSVLADIRFRCEVEWPLCLIITEENISEYGCIFTFLLQIRRAVHAMDELSRSILIDRSFHSRERISTDLPLHLLHRVYTLKNQIYHFCSALHESMVTQALHSSWGELLGQLESCAYDHSVSIDTVQEYHADYLQAIKARMMLGKNMSAAYLKLVNLLDLSLRLDVVYRRHVIPYFDACKQGAHRSKEEEDMIEDKLDKIAAAHQAGMKFLLYVLRQLHHSQPHLADLLTRLSASGFYDLAHNQ